MVSKGLGVGAASVRPLSSHGAVRWYWLRIALILAPLLAVELAVVAASWPHAIGGLLLCMALELVTGREAAFPVALVAGTPAAVVALTSILQNLTLAAIALHLVDAVSHRWRDGTHLPARLMRRLQERASRRPSWATRFGPLSLFVFMLIPFLANGAVVAAVIGRASGIRRGALVTVVGTATVLVAFAWAFFLDALLVFSALVAPGASWILTGLIVTIALIWLAVGEARQRRRERQQVSRQ